MKPIDAFFQLINRIVFMDRWKREPNNKPGKVVESMSDEAREALSQLKSEDVSVDKVREPEAWFMMGPDSHVVNYASRDKILEIEKSLGVKPPPRKKYGDYND